MSVSSDDVATSTAPRGGYDGAHVAHLWEYPNLCLALFGVQFHTPVGQQRYEGSGISDEMDAALGAAQESGPLLHNRMVTTEEVPVLMQYWRSYEDLDGWARWQPHMRWWKWLLKISGPELSFYHEIYQVKAAEAIFEAGRRPVGPALFTTTSEVTPGEGGSKDRQARFSEAQDVAPAIGQTLCGKWRVLQRQFVLAVTEPSKIGQASTYD